MVAGLVFLIPPLRAGCGGFRFRHLLLVVPKSRDDDRLSHVFFVISISGEENGQGGFS